MVAENSATCLSSGVSARIVSTSSANPMLSISSASSSTRNLQLTEVEGALLEVVHDPAGSADDDVHAAAQRRQLDAVALAAVDRQHVHAGQVHGVLLERLGDLDRELAGRREHEGLRRLLRQVETGQDRQRERRRLAGARLGEPDHVTAGHQRRDGRGLDRRGRLVAHAGDRAQHGIGEPEVGEGLVVGGRCSPANGSAPDARSSDSLSRWARSRGQTRCMSVRRVRDALEAALGPGAHVEHHANHTGVGKLSFAVRVREERLWVKVAADTAEDQSLATWARVAALLAERHAAAPVLDVLEVAGHTALLFPYVDAPPADRSRSASGTTRRARSSPGCTPTPSSRRCWAARPRPPTASAPCGWSGSRPTST